MNKSKSQANLTNALGTFNQMKMTAKESAKEYISRVDSAVSDLALLNEIVSVNSWIFILANGLRPEFVVTRKGVLFGENAFGSVMEVKNKIMQEETVNGIGKPDKEKPPKDSKDLEIAHAAFDGICLYCKRKGHMKRDCLGFKKSLLGNKNKAQGQYWCDICYKEGHFTSHCSLNPNNKGKGGGNTRNDKGSKGKGGGKGKGRKGKPGKGGRGKDNFPASYISDDAHYAKETWKSTEDNWELKEDESLSSDWYDYNFAVFETEIFQEQESFIVLDSSFVLLDGKDTKEWTLNNAGLNWILSSALGRINRPMHQQKADPSATHF
jgi:hypothetical protein